MTEKTEDEKWLDALAASADQPSSKTELEAGVIRASLLQTINSRPVYEPSESGFQRLLSDARQQRLIYPKQSPSRLQGVINAVYEFLATPACVMASVTLIVGLSVTAGWQAEQLHDTEAETVRGGSSAGQISQVVPSPQATAAAWQKELLEAGVTHAVSFETQGRILIRIKLSAAAIDLLASKRIQPPAGEWCALVIESEKVKP